MVLLSKGGSYDKIGMNTSLYRDIIPKLKDLIEFCRSMGIPVFYTEAVKEDSGIDILTNVHNILPKSRQERLKSTHMYLRFLRCSNNR